MALGDVLLARFKHAVAQSLSGGAVREGGVGAALDALALLAAPLLESLLAWCLAALSEAVSSPPGAPGGADAPRRRAAAVESAFWEAVCRLAGEAEGRAPPAHVAEALEALAFDALLAPPPSPAPAESDEAERERTARALGLLSRRRSEAVTQRCLRELEARLRTDTAAARADVAALVRAMRHLHLPLASLSEGAAAAAFLRAAAPLRWTPVKKKL